MNHVEILKRAWKILWSYKTLWVFGIILALSSGGSGGGGGGNRGNFTIPNLPQQNFNFRGFEQIGPDLDRLGQMLEHGITGEAWRAISAIILLVICVILVLAVVFTILRYVSRVALIRMVDQFEASGEKVSWRRGFQLGWSRSALRMFLIDLLIGIPVVIVFLVLFGCAFLPVILGVVTSANHEPSAVAIISTVGMFFLAILVAIVVGVAISLVFQIIWRECVLKEKGVIESIREGWKITRQHLMDVGLMWLILLGVQIAYFLLIIPVVLLLMGIGVLFGGGLAAVGYFAGGAGAHSAGLLPGIILGALLFIAILAIPMLFLGGLKETYLSSAWTLAYREIAFPPALEAEEAPPSEPAPEPDQAPLPLPS